MTGTTTSSNRVLVIFPGALGDLICVLPALRTLLRRYPGCVMELMARAELADFAVGRMGIARGHSIDRREVGLLFSSDADDAAQAAGFFGAFAAIHSFFGFDNQRMRELLPKACRGAVFFHPFRPAAEGHIAAAYLREVTAGHATFNPEPAAAKLDLLTADLDLARRLADAHGVGPGRFVLLMPGSGSPAKNWPAANYLQLAGELSRYCPVLTVLGPAENNLQATFSRLVTIVNPPLGALAGLARISAAFVGNDSGVSHLAAAAGARGVVIFGPTDPARWRPLGKVKIIACSALQRLPWQQV